MSIQDILYELKTDIKMTELYKRSILLNVESLDINLNFTNHRYHNLGLYSLKGKFMLLSDKFVNVNIECDLGFLYYLKNYKYSIKINVISNNMPLIDELDLNEIEKKHKVKYYDGLDLSLYNNMIICQNIDSLPFFYKHNAHNVILKDNYFKFNFCDIYNVELVDYLKYYLTDTITHTERVISFNFSDSGLNLEQINTIQDLECNIVKYLDVFIPFIMTFNIPFNIRLHFSFKLYRYKKVFSKKEKLQLFNNLYLHFKPLYNISNDSIYITISDFDRSYKSVNGAIFNSGGIHLDIMGKVVKHR